MRPSLRRSICSLPVLSMDGSPRLYSWRMQTPCPVSHLPLVFAYVKWLFTRRRLSRSSFAGMFYRLADAFRVGEYDPLALGLRDGRGAFDLIRFRSCSEGKTMRAVAPCSCGGDLVLGRFDRRHFLQIAGIAGLAATLPFKAWAAEGDYEAMLLSCIDPRMVTPVYNYMEKRGFSGKYSQFVIAGAAIAVVAPKFETWRPAFWDNLATSVELHRITKVIAIDHRDCGAARIAYGDSSIADPQIETKTHRE